MDKIGSMIIAIFGGVITLAIVSVLISKKSSFPAAIQAGSSALANVVAAAVNPVNTASTNGNNGLTAFATPALNAVTSVFGGTQ
jgi:hypothetical protein